MKILHFYIEKRIEWRAAGANGVALLLCERILDRGPRPYVLGDRMPLDDTGMDAIIDEDMLITLQVDFATVLNKCEAEMERRLDLELLLSEYNKLLIAAAFDSGNMLVAVTVNTSMEGYGKRFAADKVSKWVNQNQDVRDTLTEVLAGPSSASTLQTFLKGAEKAWKVRIAKTHPADVNELYAIWRPTKQLLEYARRSKEESDHLTFLIEFAGLFEYWVNGFMQPLIKFPFKHEQPQQNPEQQQPEMPLQQQQQQPQPQMPQQQQQQQHGQQQDQQQQGHKHQKSKHRQKKGTSQKAKYHLI
ncbi:hypothetical protein COCSUDRAFT_45041 [Coccomyxa subellipsoidea C-169]|uniref:Uncharacterized protein n=1 Tax=Coccomyxa subellipsoidea (strain C-169) TaxID=574566 RepID=I0YKH6_COCSC|nr:hypothetical protein COCSUDRAFT_45041 [Coccomyxa subellipsoidea C-169]EIE18895.1 hypothetical protein COCSUDRAFT_45041 [Coccomyxa subellipsoidea C-169]|eukprot:XP_005643439.1 hypothetical protein COCSUDRAFT_45041 [Coccomyxa subellipsoidea C-169]